MEKKNKSFFLFFWIVCLGFLGLYVSLVNNINVWTDEAYSIELVRNNTFLGVIKETALDVHPPLYYLLLKAFVGILGDKIVVYKIFSIIPIILLMILAWTDIRKYWGQKTAIMFILFLNAIPCMLEYVIQIRMYSLSCFFVTWAAVSAYGVWKTGNKVEIVKLTIASMGACYTHTYAMLSCVFIYIILVITSLIRWMKTKKHQLFVQSLFSGIIVSIVFLPWLRVLLIQTTSRVGNYWIEPIDNKSILTYLDYLFGTELPYTTEVYLIVIVFALLLIIKGLIYKHKEMLFALLLLLIPVLTAAVGIVISVLVTPFFVARYLIPCMGLFALFMAIAFHELETYAKVVLYIFGLTVFAVSYQENYEMEYNSSYTQEVVSYLEENMEANDYIVYNYEVYGFIYKIYFDASRTIFLNDMDFASDFDTIWYFDSCVIPWLDAQTLLEHGLKKEYVANLGIEQNDFVLYKISHK